MQKIIIRLLSLYQYLISPLFGPCCRFYPCCSEFAQLAIQRHGLVKGLFLSIKRISCCHPLHRGGHDPVPE